MGEKSNLLNLEVLVTGLKETLPTPETFFTKAYRNYDVFIKLTSNLPIPLVREEGKKPIIGYESWTQGNTGPYRINIRPMRRITLVSPLNKNDIRCYVGQYEQRSFLKDAKEEEFVVKLREGDDFEEVIKSLLFVIEKIYSVLRSEHFDVGEVKASKVAIKYIKENLRKEIQFL